MEIKTVRIEMRGDGGVRCTFNIGYFAIRIFFFERRCCFSPYDTSKNKVNKNKARAQTFTTNPGATA